MEEGNLLEALVNFLETRGGSLRASRISEFYDAYPHYQSALKSGLRAFCEGHPSRLDFLSDAGSGTIKVVASSTLKRHAVQIPTEFYNELRLLLKNAGGRIHSSCLGELYKKHPKWQTIVKEAGGIVGLTDQVPDIRVVDQVWFVSASCKQPAGSEKLKRMCCHWFQGSCKNDSDDCLFMHSDDAQLACTYGIACTVGHKNRALKQNAQSLAAPSVAADLKKYVQANGGTMYIGSMGDYYKEHPFHREVIHSHGRSLNGFLTQFKKLLSASEDTKGRLILESGDGPPSSPPAPSSESARPSHIPIEFHNKLRSLVKEAGGRIHSSCLGMLYKEHPSWQAIVKGVGGIVGLSERLSDIRIVDKCWFALGTEDQAMLVDDDGETDSSEESHDEEARDNIMHMSVFPLRWSHDSIKLTFRNGKLLVDTLDDLLQGRLSVQSLPIFMVQLRGDAYHAITGNRRLWVLKEYERLSGTPVQIRVKVLKPNPSMQAWIKKRWTTKTNGKSVTFVVKNRSKSVFPSMAFALAVAKRVGREPLRQHDIELGNAVCKAGGKVKIKEIAEVANWGEDSVSVMNVQKYLRARSDLFLVEKDVVSLADAIVCNQKHVGQTDGSQEDCPWSSVQVGTRMQVQASDGIWYAAEVLAVSANPRAKKPIKITYVGYTSDSDERVTLDRIRSKCLKAPAAQKKPNENRPALVDSALLAPGSQADLKHEQVLGKETIVLWEKAATAESWAQHLQKHVELVNAEKAIMQRAYEELQVSRGQATTDHLAFSQVMLFLRSSGRGWAGTWYDFSLKCLPSPRACLWAVHARVLPRLSCAEAQHDTTTSQNEIAAAGDKNSTAADQPSSAKIDHDLDACSAEITDPWQNGNDPWQANKVLLVSEAQQCQANASDVEGGETIALEDSPLKVSSKAESSTTSVEAHEKTTFDKLENVEASDPWQHCSAQQDCTHVSTSVCFSSHLCKIHDDILVVLDMIPQSLITQKTISKLMHDEVPIRYDSLAASNFLRLLSFRLGARPEAFCGRSRLFLHDNPDVIVLRCHLDAILQKAGFKQGQQSCQLANSLHHLGVIYPYNSPQASALTLRIGRAIIGCCAPIMDILRGTQKSLMLLGPSSCGKTTALRDAARFLADAAQVVIFVGTAETDVVTGSTGSHSLGLAWFVPSHQGSSVCETITTVLDIHTPDVLVIDFDDVQSSLAAAVCCKKAGVRLVGTVRCVLSAFVAELAHNSQDNKGLWRLSPIDVLVEMPPLGQQVWQVAHDAMRTVTNFIDDHPYEIEKRDTAASHAMLANRVA